MVVMATAAAEAMVLDFFERTKPPITPHLAKPFGSLLDEAQPFLEKATYEFAKLVKDQRNRVHPGNALRNSEPEPTRADAQQALALLERLIEELPTAQAASARATATVPAPP